MRNAWDFPSSSSNVHRIVPTAVTAILSLPIPFTRPTTFCGGLTKSLIELVMHRDVQLSTWMVMESESNLVASVLLVLATRQTIAAVLNHADVPIHHLLYPCPLDFACLTLLCRANGGFVQVIISLVVGSSLMSHVTALSMAFAADVILLPT